MTIAVTERGVIGSSRRRDRRGRRRHLGRRCFSVRPDGSPSARSSAGARRRSSSGATIPSPTRSSRPWPSRTSPSTSFTSTRTPTSTTSSYDDPHSHACSFARIMEEGLARQPGPGRHPGGLDTPAGERRQVRRALGRDEGPAATGCAWNFAIPSTSRSIWTRSTRPSPRAYPTMRAAA